MSHRLYNLGSLRAGSFKCLMPCLLLCMVLGMVACKQPHVENPPSVDFDMPVVMDTFNFASQPVEEEWVSRGRYPVIYIGPRQDTIWNMYHLASHQAFGHLLIDSDFGDYARLDSNDVLLKIDQERLVKRLDRSNRFGDGKVEILATDAHPAYLLNTSTDSLIIGSEFSLPLILQAQDPKGTWRSIQDHFMLVCGTGVKDFVLPPGQLAMTLVPVFKGDYETKLRLMYGRSFVSEEFVGRINLSQFKEGSYENK